MRALWTLALLGAAACDGGKDGADGADGTDDTDMTRAEIIEALTGDATAGATVFSDNCALCHAADGTGLTGPDLTGQSSASNIIQVALEGVGTMPSFDSLDNQEIADVTAHILAL